MTRRGSSGIGRSYARPCTCTQTRIVIYYIRRTWIRNALSRELNVVGSKYLRFWIGQIEIYFFFIEKKSYEASEEKDFREWSYARNATNQKRVALLIER